MSESQKEKSEKVVGYERFREKQPWQEGEPDPVVRPSPFEIRGEPVDFGKAREELIRRIEERGKLKAEVDARSEASTNDLLRIMDEAEQLYLDTLNKLMSAQTAVLEKLKERDPEMATFLLLQKKSGHLR